MSESSDSDDDVSSVDDILGKRKSSKTLTQYHRKFGHFVTWIGRNHPSLVVNGQLPPHKLRLINAKQLVDFFDYIKYKRNKQTNEVLIPKSFQSFQHVSGYKSAIKDHFREVCYIYYQ